MASMETYTANHAKQTRLTQVIALFLAAVLAVGLLGTGTAWADEEQAGTTAGATTTQAFTGWKTVKGKKYYYRDGVKVTGKQTIGKYTYYFNGKGVMQTGLKKIGGSKYFFKKNGRMLVKKWKKVKKKKYYFTEDGRAATFGYYKGYLFAHNGVAHKVKIKKTGNKTKDAKRVAKVIAKCCGPKKWKDIDRVQRAADYVALFSSRCKYTMKGADYSTAYGVFVAKKYSCAGSTRALGMVLSCMGYKWKHVNENKYTHQWVKLKMDGKTGYADGQVGWVGYGKHPIA